MKHVLTVLFVGALVGCGLQYIDSPPVDEFERWENPGYSPKDVKRELLDCRYGESTTIEHLEGVDRCMLKKGFRFIDPVRGIRQCDSSLLRSLPSCQSLKK